MGRKKSKKWGRKAKTHAARAEAAAERAEAALRQMSEMTGKPVPEDPATSEKERQEHRSPAYTSPRGLEAMPPAAEVP